MFCVYSRKAIASVLLVKCRIENTSVRLSVTDVTLIAWCKAEDIKEIICWISTTSYLLCGTCACYPADNLL